MFQDQARRWPRVISRRRRRRSTTRPFNTPWIATRNVSTFTFYCSLFARSLLPLSPRFTTLKTRTPRLSKALPLTASCLRLDRPRFVDDRPPASEPFSPDDRAASASRTRFYPSSREAADLMPMYRRSLVTEDRRAATGQFYRPSCRTIYALAAN